MSLVDRFEALILTECKRFPGVFEPAEDERILMKLGQNGDLGYLVRHDGMLKVRRNLVNELILFTWTPTSPGGWQEYGSPFEIGPGQAVMVAYAADRALLGALGRYEEARKPWDGLTDKARLAFMREAPTDHVLRTRLYGLIMKALQ